MVQHRNRDNSDTRIAGRRPTLRHASLPEPMFRLLPLAALVLALAACDASAPDLELATADLDDAAVTLASAVALDAGGLLEDAAASAVLATSLSGTARTAAIDRPGCRADRTYDAATGAWTAVADCERGDPDGRFYVAFARTSTYRFLDGDGQSQETREGAVSAEHAVLSGSSTFRSPFGVHVLQSLTTHLTVSDLDAELVTIDGTVQRAATDTLRGPRGERTLAYELDATLDGIQGPRGLAKRWRRAVDGTITGTLRATLTRTLRDGETSLVEIDEAFTIEFPVTGSGDRVAEILLGGRRYRADIDTGEIGGMAL